MCICAYVFIIVCMCICVCVDTNSCNSEHNLEHGFWHEGEHQKARFLARGRMRAPKSTILCTRESTKKHDLEHDFLHEWKHRKARFCARRKTLKTTFAQNIKKSFCWLLQLWGRTQCMCAYTVWIWKMLTLFIVDTVGDTTNLDQYTPSDPGNAGNPMRQTTRLRSWGPRAARACSCGYFECF